MKDDKYEKLKTVHKIMTSITIGYIGLVFLSLFSFLPFIVVNIATPVMIISIMVLMTTAVWKYGMFDD